MMPHKTERGAQAMARLAVRAIRVYLHETVVISLLCAKQMFEGIPAPYDKVKRVVVPEALKAIRMRSDRNFTLLGSLSQEVGWGYAPLVERLEAQRKIKEQAFYAEKKAKATLASKAAAAVDLSAVNKVLASNGF